MRNFWILTKLQASSLFGINKILHQKEGDEKKKGQRGLRMLLLMVFALAYMSVMYSMMLAPALQKANMLPSLLSLMATAASALVLVYSVFEVKAVLFGFGDYDMVMSWPVTVRAVAASRVASMLLYNLVYGALLLVPAGVVYAIYAHPPLWYYPVLLLVSLLLPVLPTLVGALLGTAITVATARMKKSSVLATVGQFVLMIVLVGGIMWVNMGMANLGEKAVAISGGVASIYPPAVWAQRAACGEGMPLLYLVLASVAAAAAMILLLSASFTKIHTRLSDRPHGSRFAMRRQSRSSRVRALYRREWRRYMASSLYVTNTAFGYVMMLAAGAACCFIQNAAFREAIAAPELQSVLAAIPLALGMTAAMSATTPSSISIEGKQFWIVRTLPVPARELFLSKILVSLTLAVPAILISSTLVGIGLKLTGTAWIWLYVTPLACAVFSAVFGLSVNLRFARLDWQNEAEVVKQGVSVAIAVFGSMVLLGALIAVVIVTRLGWLCGAASLLLLLASALIWAGLVKNGEKRLMNL